MGNVKVPVFGNLDQTINPWTWAFNTSGNQIGFFNLNIDLGHSSNPGAERRVLNVASYGKQLGRLEDVIDILVRRLKNSEPLSDFEAVAIADYETMRREVSGALKASS
jgi:hypothetical protein